MILVEPRIINNDMLSDYNVTQDIDQWDSAATYAEGDFVIRDPEGSVVYQSMQSGNIDNDPLDGDIQFWIPIGASNYWRMFDGQVSTQTENADSIEVSITTGRLVNSIGLLNIQGASVEIEVELPDESIVFQREIILRDYGVSNWYDYYFTEPVDLQDEIILDLPAFATGKITIKVNATGSTAKLGLIILGVQKSLGKTEWGARASIIDFSRVERDQFGGFSITKRGFSKLLSVRALIPATQATAVHNELAKYRATPVLWVGEKKYGLTIVYGIYASFDIDLETEQGCYCNLEIEGVV